MRSLTTLQFTHTSIAKTGAFENMTVGALCAILAVSVNTKRPAYKVGCRMLSMDVRTRRVVTVSVGEVHAERCPLFCDLVREVTIFAFGAFSFQEELFADSDLGDIMYISAGRAFGTGAYNSMLVSVWGGLPHHLLKK